jgi:DNA-directed RNA polymerase beta' subunit
MEEVPYVQRRLPAAGTTSGSAAHGGDTLHAALFHPIAGDSLAATAAAPRVVPLLAMQSLHFGMLDAGTVAELAVVTVTSGATGTDAPGSLSDPRMGAAPGRSHACETCNQGLFYCDDNALAPLSNTTTAPAMDGCLPRHVKSAGAFGCIQLPHPVINPLFVSLVAAILQTTCLNCCRLRLSPFYIQTMFPQRLRAQLPRLKSIGILCARQARCQFCHAPAPVVKQQGLCIFARLGSGAQVLIPAAAIFALLIRLPDADLWALGFDPNADNHPSSAVLSVLPVLPPVSRPAARTLNLKTGAPFVVEDFSCA